MGKVKFCQASASLKKIMAMIAGFANNTCVNEVQSFDFISVYQDDLYCLTDQKVSAKADSKLSRQNENSINSKKSNSRNRFLNHDIFLISVELKVIRKLPGFFFSNHQNSRIRRNSTKVS